MSFANRLSLFLATFTVVLATVAFAWVGFYGSDDLSYALGGLGWLNDFPYVGDSHWTLRHTLVAPMGALFGLFGISELTLVLPALFYYLALLLLVYSMMARHFDAVVASIAVLLLGTLPLTAASTSSSVGHTSFR